MMRPAIRGRSGITLTEILISILIMGVGLISLATLFPLGLIRLREAARMSRSAMLAESAQSDLSARNLLDPQKFIGTPWYWTPGLNANGYFYYDPFVQDIGVDLALPNPNNTYTDPVTNITYIVSDGVYRGLGLDNQGSNSTAAAKHLPPGVSQFYRPGTGLPVAYDPLWWNEVNLATVNQTTGMNGLGPNQSGQAEGRFANGLGYVAADPVDGQPSAAYGLQRLTNFLLGVGSLVHTRGDVFDLQVGSIFASPDDIVFQDDETSNRGPGAGSPIVPDMSAGSLVSDWAYTWMWTGHRADATNGSIFNGDIVVFNNRPLALDQVQTPFGGAMSLAAGEVVVEGILAPGTRVVSVGGNYAYSPTDYVIMLRWPVSGTPGPGMSDPEVRVGSWIADVTYDRDAATDLSRNYNPPAGQSEFYTGQRCDWYRVIKVEPATDDPGFPNDPGGVRYRRMTVRVGSPLKAKTQLVDNGNNTSSGAPYHRNAVLVSPYVVNVFTKAFYAR